MQAVIADEPGHRRAFSEPEGAPPAGAASLASAVSRLQGDGPNALVRWVFYLSVFAIPFARVYVPGTGERLGVSRVVQLLLLCGVISQPRICLRMVPVALLWFVAYCAVRIFSGLWLAPEMAATWWPSTFEWLQLSLPWAWIMFNLLAFPKIRRGGLWALVWGCSLCAALHLLGVGVTTVDSNILEVRTTVFGENANVVGATYAVALISLIGLGMFKDVRLSRQLLLLPLITLVGLGLAKTGSRSAGLMVVMGIIVLLFQAESFASKARRYWTLVLIGAILVAVVWQVPTVIERFRDLDPHNIGQQNPRARMAPVLWEMFLRSPIYGSGPDQYSFELTRRAMPYLIREQRLIGSHNLVLLLLVETGIIGLLIFSTGLWKALAAAWRARRNSCGFLPLALLLPLVISSMVVCNPSHYGVFWFAIVYALAGAA
jgi:O-antigen ligase